jgi:uncharacterized protein YjbI with pentapeptide repeats
VVSPGRRARTAAVGGWWLTRGVSRRSPAPGPRELADLPYADALTPHAGGLEPGYDYDTVHFDKDEFEEPDASGARFLECAFTGVSFTDGRLRRSRFIDAWLKDARITLTDLAETQWVDTTFAGGVVAGVQAFGARLNRVVFAGCKLDSVNFREAQLTDVTFADCLVRNVDFAGAKLRQTKFTGCQLTGTDFSRTSLDRVDLRGSELGLIVGPDPLRGAIISSGQLASIAPVLAEALGIVVDDDTPEPVG